MQLKKSNLFLYFGSLLLMLKTIISASKMIPYNDTLDTLLSILAILCMAMCIILQDYKIKVLLIYLCIVLLTFYNAFVTKNSALAVTIITCLASRKTDFNKYIKFIFVVEFSLLTINTFLAVTCHFFGLVNIIQNIGGVQRYDFGMQHPNSFAALVFNLMIMWVWLYWNKIKYKHIVFMAVMATALYMFCKTRTNFAAMIIIIGIIFLCKADHGFRHFVRKLAYIIIPLTTLIIITAVIFYKRGNIIALLLNKVLNARILLGAYALNRSGITFFGQDLTVLYTGTTWDPMWQLNAFTFDCIYTYMIVNQGIIWLIILSYLFIMLARSKNIENNISIIAWALYGITEVQGLNCFSCMPILLIVQLFQKGKKQNGKNSSHNPLLLVWQKTKTTISY